MTKLIMFCSMLMLGLVIPSSPSIRAGSDYNGSWWIGADQEERKGYLNGLADCMTWEARRAGFSATPEQIEEKIDRHYREMPEERHKSIEQVWRLVTQKPQARREPGPAEVWRKPHWYLNGDWWVQVNESEQTGYVEGYTSCVNGVNGRVNPRFRQPVATYWKEIDDFVRANPKLGNESLATTLKRFK